MSIFDDLRAQFTQWHGAHAAYDRDSAVFALRFLNNFKAYIQAPDSYKDMGGNTHWYVQPMSVRCDNDGKYTFKEADCPSDAIERCTEDGFWETGIKLTIDRADNTFPKSYFTYLVRFRLRDTKCEIEVGFDKEGFSFDTSDIKTQCLVFDYMIDVLKRVLAMRPSEVPQKEPIGFRLPRPENNA